MYSVRSGLIMTQPNSRELFILATNGKVTSRHNLYVYSRLVAKHLSHVISFRPFMTAANIQLRALHIDTAVFRDSAHVIWKNNIKNVSGEYCPTTCLYRPDTHTTHSFYRHHLLALG